MGGLRGMEPAPSLRPRLHALADAAAASSAPVLCHRDYHSRNLMVRGDGSLAMVDFQDARWGPDTYDLASLLRDAYVEIDEGLVERMVARFGDAQDLRARFDLVAAERMIKALGTFGYQASVRGNSALPRGRTADAAPFAPHAGQATRARGSRRTPGAEPAARGSLAEVRGRQLLEDETPGHHSLGRPPDRAHRGLAGGYPGLPGAHGPPIAPPGTDGETMPRAGAASSSVHQCVRSAACTRAERTSRSPIPPRNRLA